MEFEFGTNWSYFSHYVGDIFGAPLAIEGLMAFFLEATFVGLMFFGWDRLSKLGHLFVDLHGGARHQPLGAVDPDRQRLDAEPGRRRASIPRPCAWRSPTSRAVLFNPVAQAKFVHTVSAGYVDRLGLRARHLGALSAAAAAGSAVARRSMTVAAAFGLASALSVVVLGDECGYTLTDNQKMKLAAIEAAWHTEPAPAGITAVRPARTSTTRTTRYAVRDPLGAGPDRHPQPRQAGDRHVGAGAGGAGRASSPACMAYDARRDAEERSAERRRRAQVFAPHGRDLGYGLLLKRYVADPRTGHAGSRSSRRPGTRCRTCR